MNPTSHPLSDEPTQLAIETTGRLGSLAVLKGADVLRHVNLSPSARSAATLTPQLEEMLRWCEQANDPIEFVSVADGPGSFTGLRIGVTTAKTLCYARSIPLVAVDSLAAIAAAAFAACDDAERLIVVLNAYRGQVFAGTFDRPSLLPELDSIPDHWSQQNRRSQVVPGSQVSQLASQFPEMNFHIAGEERALGDLDAPLVSGDCDAIGVGLLGLRAALIENFIDPLKLIPRYLKPSAAEEKAASAK